MLLIPLARPAMQHRGRHPGTDTQAVIHASSRQGTCRGASEPAGVHSRTSCSGDRMQATRRHLETEVGKHSVSNATILTGDHGWVQYEVGARQSAMLGPKIGKDMSNIQSAGVSFRQGVGGGCQEVRSREKRFSAVVCRPGVEHASIAMQKSRTALWAAQA